MVVPYAAFQPFSLSALPRSMVYPSLRGRLWVVKCQVRCSTRVHTVYLESRSNWMYHKCIRYMSCNKILWTHSIEFYISYGFGLCKIWRVQHIQTNRAAYWGFPMQTLTNIYAAGQNSVLGAGGNGAMPKGLSLLSIHVWIGAAMFPTPNHCTPAHRRTSISQHNELPF